MTIASVPAAAPPAAIARARADIPGKLLDAARFLLPRLERGEGADAGCMRLTLRSRSKSWSVIRKQDAA